MGVNLKALASDLLPHLRPHLVQVARAAVDASLTRVQTRVEAGYLLTHDPTTGRATVALDVDQVSTDVRAIGVYPLAPGDRVMVLFAPPHGGYIIGHGQGTPVVAIPGRVGSMVVTPTAYATTMTVDGPVLHRPVQAVFHGVVDVNQDATAAAVSVKPQISFDDGATWAGSADFDVALGGSGQATVAFMEMSEGQPTDGRVIARLQVNTSAGTTTLPFQRGVLCIFPLYDYAPQE